MRGRQLSDTRITANLKLAIEDFREATEIDPNFALAWVGLADAIALDATYSGTPIEESWAAREEAIQHALEIDPELGEAWTSLGLLQHGKRELEAAEITFQKAIALSPNYASAWHWYGNLMLNWNSRTQEQVDLLRKASELDPRSAIIGSSLAGAYWWIGSYARAESQFEKTIELNPGFSQVQRHYGQYWSGAHGRMDKAIELMAGALRLDPEAAWVKDRIILNLLELEEFDLADQFRMSIAESTPDSWRVGAFDITIAGKRGNKEALKEAWNWTKPRIQADTEWVFDAAIRNLLINDDIASARQIINDAGDRWLNRENWSIRIEGHPSMACNVAWTLSQTGDQALGAALLDQSLTFVEDLFGLIEHPGELGVEVCYLAAGETEKALEVIETVFAHNHIFGWKDSSRLPLYEPIRFEPRYQEMNAEVELRLAEQREAVKEMNLGASL